MRGGNHTYGGDFTIERAAEVINLERNVLITGDHDDFESTHVGLHTIGGYNGVVRMTYTRVEYCGQSGVGGVGKVSGCAASMSSER